MMNPIVQKVSMRAIPTGLPQISRILASGSFNKPAAILAGIHMVPTSACDAKELVTNGE